MAAKEGKLVEIYIWRASTMELVKKICDFHRRAVRHLQFSPSGKYLLSVGQDNQNSAAVYEVSTWKRIATTGVDGD